MLIEVTWRSEAIVMSFDENKPISTSAHAFLAFLKTYDSQWVILKWLDETGSKF